MKRYNLNFTFRNATDADDTTEIMIEGTIGRDWWEEYVTGSPSENTSEAFRKKLAAVTTNRIRVIINSFGGDLRDGLAIYDQLLKHPAEVETVVEGLTASAATLIAQAGSTRKMSLAAAYLVHQVQSGFCGYFSTQELSQMHADSSKLTGMIADIYATRSGKSKDEILELMARSNGAGEWLTADEAKEWNLIDEVVDYATSNAGSPTVSTTASTEPQPHQTAGNLPMPNGLPPIPGGKVAAIAATSDARKRLLTLLTIQQP